MPAPKIDIALIHYPVCDRNNQVIGSAVTNLDLHDIARAGRTYGIDSFYVVTPFADQQELVSEIIEHWQNGYGAGYNTLRKEALGLVSLCSDLEDLYRQATEKWGKRPTVLATSARENARSLGYQQTRKKLMGEEPLLLLFGTGWGLAPEALDGVDHFLPPIKGRGDYNHLSVRSAVSIILDRLLADHQGNEQSEVF